MNILHVVNIYFVLPFFIGEQFRYFKDKGHKLYVACSPSEHLKGYSEKMGFDYIETPVNRSISLSEDFKSIRNICKLIKENNIDLVIGHTPKGGLLAMIAAKLCNVKHRIYFRHGLVYETSKGFKRFMLKSVDRLSSACATKVICVSPSVLAKSNEDKLANPSKQIILGHGTCNGVDTRNQFNPALIDSTKINILKEKYNISPDDFVIGYSGRLVRDKGIIDLIQAFELIENTEHCKLLLVGMFEERDALPEDIKNKILSHPQIIYTGFINGGMENYYALMDLYVLPSYREGFPTGVLEAQSMGLPIVTTRVTGCCDSIVEGVTGLFADNTPQDLQKKIDMIRLDKKIDGRNGRKWVEENFDSRLVWGEIEKELGL